MLYPIKRNNKYGFINDSGKIVIEPNYKYIGEFSNNVCSVTNELDEFHFNYNNKDYFHSESTIIDIEGNILFPFKKYTQINEFYCGFAFCYHQKLKKYGVIDKQGTEVIPFIFEKEEIEYSHFSNNLARIKKENKFGFINIENSLIIPCIYDQASNFENGFSLVKIKSKDFLIDTNGTIFKSEHKIVSTFKENRGIVKSNKKFGFIDEENNLIIEYLFDDVLGHFVNGICLVKRNGKYGAININGENVIDFIFDDVRWIGNNVFPAKIKNKWTLVDLQGNIKFVPIFNYIQDFNKFQHQLDYFDSNLTRAVLNGKDYYINVNGEIISEVEILESKINIIEVKDILSQRVEQKQVWDKAKWSYDGFSITKQGAIKPFYFILKWFKSKGLLTDEGLESLKDKNNLEIRLQRSMFKENAAIFLDYFYDFWFQKQHIVNYQIDPSLKFENDENLETLWEYFQKNYG
ncbi:WG repeat-containing protein [Riemerella anatipestifer]|uniref:WG repeat-containing protein n=3 Tax=Riemerella anatipestifer TaxID=34085 RepID=A0AAP6HGU3_RIEAN|nr:WG repeat-containing protein [Riemerella anatipestifer]MCO7355907.1 WG repeat-containing protein [Riemerella anatipestifer]MCU7540389.1 WG repeat-containing protein [Riemerella anatipestifer]MCU7571512.1 WG repeat-containing protein [Riemerella anatipestifer]MCU7598711.1 WG repeat-containing protein [Riemerella anatipestifer]MCW0495547.1 WG repeat-containing protein [Riemerella anatipestifer]